MYRFGTVAKISNTQNLKIPIKIKTQFLSLGIIYGAYLVFKFCDPKMVSSKPYVDLKYKTASGKLNSYIAERRDGEWMMIELCRFRSHSQINDFEFQLKSFCGHPCGSGPIFIDGIEFRPINNVSPNNIDMYMYMHIVFRYFILTIDFFMSLNLFVTHIVRHANQSS